MKSISFLQILLLGFMASMLLVSCSKTTCTSKTTYVIHTPVFESRESINAKIGNAGVQPIENPGKIFAIGQYILLNEVEKGIHIIDNSDKTNPTPIDFINIPGSLDVYILGGKLYSDSYNDIVVLDISDIRNVQLIERVNEVFHNSANFPYLTDEEGNIAVDYIESTETYTMDCSENGHYNFFIDAGPRNFTTNADMTVFNSFSNEGGNVFGVAQNDVIAKAGSMSRFGANVGVLYAVNQYELISFQVGANLERVHTEGLGFGIETIFPYNEYLFVGGQNGMYIVDASDALYPKLISTFTHANSCDPVVVNGNHAYVTLRSGNECQGFTNQLDVVDISDITNPVLDKTYPMHNPHGLGIAHDLLFLCDGTDGLKIFNKSDPLKISDNLIKHYKDIHAFDVIPLPDVLLMIGEDGLAQYDYSDINDIKLLSVLAVK